MASNFYFTMIIFRFPGKMTYFVPTALILLVAFASAYAETNEQERESLDSSELSPKRNEKGKSFQKKMFLKAVAYPMGSTRGPA